MTRDLAISLTHKDFELEFFRSGGPGGQHQNKTSSGVRIKHPASGAVGESRSERSQYQNKKLALEHLVATPKFKVWLNRQLIEQWSHKTVEQVVDEMMDPKNLKVEVKESESGSWEELLTIG